MDTYLACSSRRKREVAPLTINMKPRRPCPVCGRWTTAIYMHMIYSHNWTDEQVNDLKRLIREERLTKHGSLVYGCHRCGLGYTSSIALCTHLVKCRGRIRPRKKEISSLETDRDKKFMWYLEGGRQLSTKQLPSRPLVMPPLPEQLSESEKGSVICPVPRCTGRFTNHDSLSYHCMLEHSELGAAGTPQNFAIRQYRFEDKDAYKEWLYERCEETCTSFSTKTSMWSGYAMYRCNRAGTFKTSGTLRSGCTSKKAQSHCSAFLRTSEYSDGSIDVTCCFGHISHELDPTALRLNERQCGVLQKLLERNLYLSDICAQMKAEYPPTNRLHYTTSNDIRNLALRLGLPVRLREKKIMRRTVDCNMDEDHENKLVIEEEVGDGLQYPQRERKDTTTEQVIHCEETTSDNSSSLSVQSDISSGTDNRPSRTRRAPRRFEDG